MSSLFPTIDDIQDDPKTHAVALRQIKNAVEQITGQRPGIQLVFARQFVSALDPQKLPVFKGAADKTLRLGDQWINIADPTNPKLLYWDSRTKTWQLVAT